MITHWTVKKGVPLIYRKGGTGEPIPAAFDSWFNQDTGAEVELLFANRDPEKIPVDARVELDHPTIEFMATHMSAYFNHHINSQPLKPLEVQERGQYHV